ncbi:MAG: PAS domain-containing protein [Pyrinomonadaceae bacterium]|nr:PAS domain-containing protein [Sphingobacteriaceae bacterium]
MKPQTFKEKTEIELDEIFQSFERSLEIERRYHELLDNIQEGFQVVDYDWRYVYVNDAVVKHSKLSREDLIGFTMIERYPGIEKTAMFNVLQNCMKSRISKKFINEFTYPDQSKAWFELSIQPIKEGIYILSTDITEHKKIELAREQHIKEIEQLLFKISHEVRHPVCHIMGVSNLLDNSLITLEEFKIVISHVKKSVGLLDTYTRELTQFVSEMKMNADDNKKTD